MSTILYLLCLMILVQFVFLILIYDAVTKRYRKLEQDFDQLRHEKCHKEVALQKIIILEDAKYRSLASHPEDHSHRAYIKLEIDKLWKSINVK